MATVSVTAMDISPNDCPLAASVNIKVRRRSAVCDRPAARITRSLCKECSFCIFLAARLYDGPEDRRGCLGGQLHGGHHRQAAFSQGEALPDALKQECLFAPSALSRASLHSTRRHADERDSFSAQVGATDPVDYEAGPCSMSFSAPGIELQDVKPRCESRAAGPHAQTRLDAATRCDAAPERTRAARPSLPTPPPSALFPVAESTPNSSRPARPACARWLNNAGLMLLVLKDAAGTEVRGS